LALNVVSRMLVQLPKQQNEKAAGLVPSGLLNNSLPSEMPTTTTGIEMADPRHMRSMRDVDNGFSSLPARVRP